MALMIDRETGSLVKIENDMLKGYEQEAEDGIGDFPACSNKNKSYEPGWVGSGEPISRGQMKDSIERALETYVGLSYELLVNGRRRSSGIVTGIDTRASRLERVRLEAIQDSGKSGITETAFPLDLVLSGGRGQMQLKIHYPDFGGVFAKGRLIEATKNLSN